MNPNLSELEAISFEVSSDPKCSRGFDHLDPNATRYHFFIDASGYVSWFSNRGHRELDETVIQRLYSIFNVRGFKFINV